MAPRRVLARLLASAALAFTAAPSSADPPAVTEPARAPVVPPAGAEIVVPAGIPVALDGAVLSGEWEDSPILLFSPTGPVLRLKVVRGTLLVGVVTDRAWPSGGDFRLYARAGDADGSIDDAGTVQVDFEPVEHNRPHLLFQVRTAAGWERRDAAAVFRASGLDTLATVEGAIPLSALGVTGDGAKAPAKALRWVAFWRTPFRATSHLTIPSGLDLGAVEKGLPKDLQTSARWAKTSAWFDATGPGAFPKADWTAWTEADREMAEKGQTAHALAISVREGSEEAGKHDGPVERGIVENLRWIASREPLSGNDEKALAIGLWRVNRAEEALGVLDGYGLTSAARRDDDVLWLKGLVAFDAERFGASASAFDAYAKRLGPRLGAPFVDRARESQEVGKRYAAELASRREDAAKGDLPLALLETTKGIVLLRLHEDDAPESAKQFVHLVEEAKTPDGKPFYAGTCFHRVVANGLVQGGDPTSKTEGCDRAGAGGCPWWIPAEPTPRHGFFRGSVGWAMGTDRRVRSQFFLMTAPKPTIADNGFTCFATVVAGMDVVDRMETGDVILSARILSKRPHEYVPKKSY